MMTTRAKKRQTLEITIIINLTSTAVPFSATRVDVTETVALFPVNSYIHKLGR